jgi:PAS domain S-box-containing protein
MELAPDGVLVSDDDGRIVMANRHIETLFGHDRNSLIGTPVEMLVPVRWRDAHYQHRARYGSAPRVRAMGVGPELFGAHADGSEFPVEISLSPVVTERGTATVVIIRDVTRQRVHERAARAALVHAENGRIATDLNERVSRHLHASGLTLTGILAHKQLDDDLAARLHEVIEELDTAIKDIHNTVLARFDDDTTIPPAA